jgi:hypothetical protein
MNIVIKQGALPPKKKKKAKSKYDFLHTIGMNEYAMLGDLTQKESRKISNILWKFNKENGRKLGLRTTDNGTVIYRKL